MSPFSTCSFIIAALMAAIQLTLMACRAEQQFKPLKSNYQVPDYPGLLVYHELEDILRDKVKTDSLETNFAYLDDLLDKLEGRAVKPRALIGAVRLILALRVALDEQRCDYVAAKATALNLNALENENEQLGDLKNKKTDNKELKRLLRLDIIIRRSVERIAAQCGPQVEENLELAIKSIDDDGYTNLTSYLSQEFISNWTEWAKSKPGQGIQWKKINQSLSWSRHPFNQQELMLQQLFRLTSQKPELVAGEPEFREANGEEKWPTIGKQQVIKNLIQAVIVRPCMSYLKLVENNVFKLINTVAKYHGPEWTDRFLEQRSSQFLYDLFRYEFCHLEAPVLGHQLWKTYRDLRGVSTSPNS